MKQIIAISELHKIVNRGNVKTIKLVAQEVINTAPYDVWQIEHADNSEPDYYYTPRKRQH